MQRSFEIRGRTLGLSGPCFVIGEAGSNHNGSLEQALALIDVAAEAGCDAVKFQVFKAKRLYPEAAGRSDYLGDPRSIFDIISAMELPEEWLPRLRVRADQHDLAFIASPFHEEAVAVLDPYVDAFKIASYELTHAPLLREVAKRNKPVIMSTGASDLDEIREAVATLEAAGCDRLAIMQCTAAYPTPPEAVNARALVTLREEFEIPTGLSDHSEHPEVAPMAAAALGAAVLEKHYTLSKYLPGPDHAFAVEPEGLRRLVAGVRATERVVGSGTKAVLGVEDELRGFARRVLMTTKAVTKGEPFSRDNVDVLRRGKLEGGLAPKHLEDVLRAVAARDLAAETPLTDEDLDGCKPVVRGLRLCPAKKGDADIIHRWANDPMTREASFSPEPIPLVDHVAWFCRELERADHHLFIVQHQGDPVGFVRLNTIPEHQGVCLVSINIAPEARQRGIGTATLKAAVAVAKELNFKQIQAQIRPSNEASRRAFTRAGFVHERDIEVSGQAAQEWVRGC
ncbi:Spore coat polysaccharide biosynthesis protein SpsE [Enhygromyxa salina]|uniref:Spore coat polysaccharide biosynthesis protein SpsE n=2 Tax=Enhygromyxa salina TaxID=215803 RepID=A0A2S9XR80_9BACT|nr:Spore coat polysaccharide biosynthesis protein SpsE [Enhygromyxa salina]